MNVKILGARRGGEGRGGKDRCTEGNHTPILVGHEQSSVIHMYIYDDVGYTVLWYQLEGG